MIVEEPNMQPIQIVYGLAGSAWTIVYDIVPLENVSHQHLKWYLLSGSLYLRVCNLRSPTSEQSYIFVFAIKNSVNINDIIFYSIIHK